MAYRSRYSNYSSGYRRQRPPRWPWLVGLIGLLLLGGAGAWSAGWLGPLTTRIPGLSAPTPTIGIGVASPTTAEVPVATSLPVVATLTPGGETALAVGRRYLAAWEAGNFAAMYALLAPSVQARVARESFIGRHENIRDEAGLRKVTTVLAAGVPENATSLSIEVTSETAIGTIVEQQQLLMIRSDGQWGVDWQPSLIFRELKAERTVRFLPDTPVRGRILDRHGTVLAHQGEAPLVGVIPAEIKDEGELLANLSKLLNLEPEVIKKKYGTGRPDWFMPIKRLPWSTPETDLVKLQAAAAGIQVRMVPERIYPLGHLASHVVGYVAEAQAEDLPKGFQPGDRIGRTGIEAAAEKELAGERGGRLLIVEKDGTPAVTLLQRKARPGADITLTIDLNVQRTAEAALGDKRGAVVTLDPNTGAVLAMASKPSYDPNDFILGISDESWAKLNDEKLRPLTNRTLDGVYPPGSIFKVITMTAGMELLGMPPDEMFTCNGSFQVPKAAQVWGDWKPGGHGRLTLVRGLTTSCDIVFYTIGLRLDREINDRGESLAAMARSFGLGQPTGLTELPEASGNVPDDAWKRKTFQDVWATGDNINFSIGQGFLLVTPLQMANVYAAIANGGTLYSPFLIQRVTLPGGPDIRVTEPKARGKLPTSPRTLQALREGLNAVPTALGGTGYTAFKDYTGPPAAGKTGTAETNVKDITHAWFASYAPQVEAKMAVASLVEEGKDAEGEGSRAAAPIARAIYEQNLAGAPRPAAPPAPRTVNPPPAAKPGPAPTARPGQPPAPQPAPIPTVRPGQPPAAPPAPTPTAKPAPPAKPAPAPTPTRRP